MRGLGTEVIEVVEARIRVVKEVKAGPHNLESPSSDKTMSSYDFKGEKYCNTLFKKSQVAKSPQG